MDRQKFSFYCAWLGLLLAAMFGLSACGAGGSGNVVPVESLAPEAQTVVAQSTANAAMWTETADPKGNLPAPEVENTPGAIEESEEVVPTEAPAPTEEPPPTEELEPTEVPEADNEGESGADEEQDLGSGGAPENDDNYEIRDVCDAAEFVEDVNIPDGEEFEPGNGFEKTWRVRNVGTCIWTNEYDLVFADGLPMGHIVSKPLRESVAPGETVDLTIQLTAPNDPGTYRSYWQLRNASNDLFGVGANSDDAFWVEIVVKGEQPVSYSLAANYCRAEWRNSWAIVACPSPEDKENGFVRLLDKPIFDTGEEEEIPAIHVHPDNTMHGAVVGEFPAYRISEGDHFQAGIGCLYNNADCEVVFVLGYRAEDGEIVALQLWNQQHDDDNYQNVDVPLRSFAGQDLRLVLAVLANGDATGDDVFWLNPRIER
ncbi:MAG: hypothetical protein JXB38_14185 [Anaerolineales bacterium]|nr:hypothetical protein [Anaerolineales bacterium]